MNNQNPPTFANIAPNEYVTKPCSHQNLFSRSECMKIREYGKDLPAIDGSMGGQRFDKSIRDSSVKWISPNPGCRWIFERLQNTIQQVNRFYKFDIAGIEAVQLARYGIGHFYGWHLDIGQKFSSTRKLSLSVQLSDENEYDGGVLEFNALQGFESPREIGAAIIFPSYLSHQVTTVNRGERWSLVAWVHGNPFR